MSTPVVEAASRLAELMSGAAHERDPQWMKHLRGRAVKDFRSRGLPSAREENWRYTTLDFLGKHAFVPPTGDVAATMDVRSIDALGSEAAAIRLVFVNGRFASRLSTTETARDGLVIQSVAACLENDPAMLEPHLAGAASAEADVFGAMNTALMEDGAFVRVAAGTRVPEPVEILHISTGGDRPGLVHPHHLVVLEAGAEATVIERYAALAEGLYFNNAVTTVDLGEGARLRHERLQEESPNGYHLSALRVRQAAGSAYHLATASLGGIWARTGVAVAFEGEGATAELDGLYLAGDRQLSDVHLDVRHQVPGCTSRETFRGILDGRGRAVFDGRVLVAKDAQKTDAQLANDNLVLSRNAEVDTKPQLEIYADDVRCSHGTTVGQLDDNMLFYLRSRGIDSDTARQMLCLGFAAGSLEAFSSTSLRERAEALLARRLTTSSREGA